MYIVHYKSFNGVLTLLMVSDALPRDEALGYLTRLDANGINGAISRVH